MDGNVLGPIYSDADNLVDAINENRYEEAERRVYTLLRTLHRELPTHKVQQVLGGVVDEWEVTDG